MTATLKRYTPILMLLTLSLSPFAQPGSAFANIIHVPGDQPSIQSGLNNSSAGDTVLVAPGVYNETVEFPNNSVTLASDFIFSNDQSDITSTIIDGGTSNSVVSIESNPLSEFALIGFTLRNGFGFEGGGLLIEGTTVRAEWNYIHSNLADAGGGIYISNGECLIQWNTIEGNNFISPSGHPGGGIAVLDGSSCEIAFNTIYNNTNQDGGGIAVYASQAFIHNNVIVDNHAFDLGGGLRCDDSSQINMINNVVANNQASHGGGLDVLGNATVSMKNTIVWGNTASLSGNQIREAGGQVNASWCDIEDGWQGTGNFDIDPLFRDPLSGDYHLQAPWCGDEYDSPCIDTGDPEIMDDSLDCEFGLATIRSDIGAYGGISEFQAEAILSLSPTTLEFDTLAPGDAASLDVILSNDGQIDLTVDDVTVPTGYWVANAWPITIEPNNSITASVWFQPENVGDYVDTLIVLSNATNSPTPLPVEGYCREANSVGEWTTPLPLEFQVGLPYPNPFNPSVTIMVTLSSPSFLQADLFDVNGRFIRTVVAGNLPAGESTFTIDASDLPTGNYFCRFDAGKESTTRRFTLLK